MIDARCGARPRLRFALDVLARRLLLSAAPLLIDPSLISAAALDPTQVRPPPGIHGSPTAGELAGACGFKTLGSEPAPQQTAGPHDVFDDSLAQDGPRVDPTPVILALPIYPDMGVDAPDPGSGVYMRNFLMGDYQRDILFHDSFKEAVRWITPPAKKVPWRAKAERASKPVADELAEPRNPIDTLHSAEAPTAHGEVTEESTPEAPVENEKGEPQRSKPADPTSGSVDPVDPVPTEESAFPA